MSPEVILSIEDLSVEYRRGAEKIPAVRGVSLEIRKGERLGVAGESGCGKSTLALSILRLLPERESRVTGGRVIFEGNDLLKSSTEALRKIRGGRVGVVFQDPFSALNPVLTIGEQVEECLEAPRGAADRAIRQTGTVSGDDRAEALRLLERVRLPSPERVYSAFPHQISGGQRQRVCLAMAVAGRPALLIADEPTTALDVTLQREVLDLLDKLRAELGMALFFITHNLGLLSERTDRLAVMYAGEIVEIGPTAAVLNEPRHPYTQGLLKSLPRLRAADRASGRSPSAFVAGAVRSAERTADRRPLPMLPGQPPDPRSVPSGCPFHPRCPNVFDRCPGEDPVLRDRQGRNVACHLYL